MVLSKERLVKQKLGSGAYPAWFPPWIRHPNSESVCLPRFHKIRFSETLNFQKSEIKKKEVLT